MLHPDNSGVVGMVVKEKITALNLSRLSGTEFFNQDFFFFPLFRFHEEPENNGDGDAQASPRVKEQ